jgi:hypothetical protein
MNTMDGTTYCARAVSYNHKMLIKLTTCVNACKLFLPLMLLLNKLGRFLSMPCISSQVPYLQVRFKPSLAKDSKIISKGKQASNNNYSISEQEKDTMGLYIKPFTSVIYSTVLKTTAFATDIHFHLSLIFAVKVRTLTMK